MNREIHDKFPVFFFLLSSGFILLLLASAPSDLRPLSSDQKIFALFCGIFLALFVSGFEFLWHRRVKKQRYKPSFVPLAVMFALPIVGCFQNKYVGLLIFIASMYLFSLAIVVVVYEKATNQKWVTFSQLYDRPKSMDNKKPEGC